MHPNHFTAALNHSKRDLFILAASSGNGALTFRRVHIAGFTTDQGFIDLDFTGRV